MYKRDFLIVLALTILLCFSQREIEAQSDVPRFEVGGHFTSLRLSDFDATEPGVGGRLTYNVTDNIALEGEVNVFPRERELEVGRKVQGLFGARIGLRRERFGVFGKVRPGFVRFDSILRNRQFRLVCTAPGVCTLQTVGPSEPTFNETNFALDVGGVVELYPSRRTIVRFDVGNTIIHSGSNESVLVRTNDPLRSSRRLTRSTSHNLQFSVGFGFRF